MHDGETNFASRTIWTGDNLDIMRGMNSDSVDLIYLDPPFNSNADYAAPIGSKAAGAEFKDTWGLDDVKLIWHGEIQHERPGLYSLLKTTREIHGDSMMSYLIYMAVRIIEMHRLLKPTGSIYLHCDPTASHYLKLLLDAIFGKKNFRNEIVWCYGGRGMAKTRFQRKHDTILFYGARAKGTFFNAEGASRSVDEKYVGRYNKEDENGRRYARIKNRDGSYSNVYLKPVVREDWWQIPFVRGNESVGYPTQKPLELLCRIIKASSTEDAMVLDPFCGCATACIAAESLSRRWVGIDISPKAAELVTFRMKRDLGVMYQGAHREDIPKRTDLGFIPKYNSQKNKDDLYGRQGGFCNGCGEHFKKWQLEIDHIIAKSKGGSDHPGNLQLLCSPCNRTKGNETQEELLLRLIDKGWMQRRHIAQINGSRVNL